MSDQASFEMYGVRWPAKTSALDVELQCWRRHAFYNSFKKNTLQAPYIHFANAWKIISPARISERKAGYIFSEWTVRRIRSWCDNSFMTWWGPSSSGKTTDAAHIAIITWLAAPDETTIQVCSTSMGMLEKRIWREVAKVFSRIRNNIPGVMVPSDMKIVLRDEVEETNPTNGIFGVPVGQGSDGIKGVHNTYNYMMIDEMQDTDPKALEEWDNLSTGVDYKFLGMGNPNAWTNPLGRASRPSQIKLRDLDPDVHTEWKTEKGVCLFFDGRKSPAIKEPEKYPFLLNQRQIDDMAVSPGVNSPQFWTQRIGFIPRDGLQETVLSESLIVASGGMDKAVWKYGYVTLAGLDPAFTTGGDKRILRFGRIGELVTGVWAVSLYRRVEIFAAMIKDADGKDIPVSYDFADKVIKECKAEGVTSSYLGMDTTGAQTTLADIIDERWGGKIHRVDFAGSASDESDIDGSEVSPKKKYKNRVTELWYTFSRFVRSGQIRDMREEESWQFSSRRLIPPGDGTNRLLVEPKKMMKKMVGKSPDDADACVVLIDVAVRVLGLRVGGGLRAHRNFRQDKNGHDLDSSEANYSTDVTKAE
jgi:hypothetical protein